MGEIESTSAISQFYGKNAMFGGYAKGRRNSLDMKIQEIVLTQIKSSPGSLLVTASLPWIIDLIPATLPLDKGRNKKGKPVKEKSSQRAVNLYPLARGKLIPIGLLPCKAFPPLNALMQLIVFIPGFREIFSFAPHSFQPIGDFVDQYILDQQRNQLVSSADSNQLIQLLFHKLPSYFLRKFSETDFAGFLFGLVHAAFGKMASSACNSIAFRPQWHAKWDPSLPFSSAIDFLSRPPELFVTIQNKQQLPTCSLIQRQFFTKSDSYCYDLDAFIEYQEENCIAYLKTADGIWYRCLDSNVIAIRSNHLKMPFSRCAFLHYTRIWPV